MFSIKKSIEQRKGFKHITRYLEEKTRPKSYFGFWKSIVRHYLKAYSALKLLNVGKHNYS